MKKILFTTFTACLFMTGINFTYGQQAEGINYQAVIRNSGGTVLANQNVNMKFSILSGSSSGTVEYAETKAGTTNAQGVLSTVIGTGTPTTGVWKNLTWLNGPYFIKVEADPTGGSTFADLGTSQLVSVPFAKQSNGVVLFDNGTQNPDKMFVSHSSTYSNWGMRYNDSTDAIQFVASGNPSASIGVSSGTIKTDGEINRTSTGTANLVPIAYGTMLANGTIKSGTGNFTVTKTGTGAYSITITGETYFYTDYSTICSMAGGGAGQISSSSVSGNLLIFTYNGSGVATDQIFAFVTYKN